MGATGDVELRSTVVNGEVMKYYACYNLNGAGCPGIPGTSTDLVCPNNLYLEENWYFALNLTSLPSNESVCMCSHAYGKKNPIANCTGFLGDLRAECLTGPGACGEWGLGTYIWFLDGVICGSVALVMMCQAIALFRTLHISGGGIKMDSTTTTLIFLIFSCFGQFAWFGAYPFIVVFDNKLYWIYESIGIPFSSAFTTLFLLNASLMWLTIVQSSKRLKASGSNLKGPYRAIVICFSIFASGSILFTIYILGNITLASAIAGLWLVIIAVVFFVAACQLETLRQMLQGTASKDTGKASPKTNKRHGIAEIIHVAKRTAAFLVLYLLATGAWVAFPKTNTPLSLNGNPIVLFGLFTSLLLVTWSILSYARGVINNKMKKARVAPEGGGTTQVTSVG